jgi:hypothetical protein
LSVYGHLLAVRGFEHNVHDDHPMENGMGELIRKLTSWVRQVIASKTSGDIARFLMVVLPVAYAVDFVLERIL